MPERESNSQYSIELNTTIGRETLLPNVQAGEYLPQWLADLQNNELDWFAGEPDPKRLLGGVYVSPEYRTGNDFTVVIPALQKSLTPKLIPAVGVSHCYEGSVLHGQVNLLLPQLSDMNRAYIKQVLASVNATANLDDSEPYYTRHPLVPLSPVSYNPLQTVYAGKYDLLSALDLEAKDEFLGLFDPNVRKATAAAVYIMRERGVMSPMPDTSYASLTPYQARFIGTGHPLVGFDEYDEEADSGYIQRNLRNVLEEEGIDEDKSLINQLSTYYDNHQEVEAMFKDYPDMNIDVYLGAHIHRVHTDTIINFADYWKAIAKLVPQASIPIVPAEARKLHEIDDIHNMLLIGESGEKLDLYLSRSSGQCARHLR